MLLNGNKQVDQHWGTKADGNNIPMILAVNKHDLIEKYESDGTELDPFMTDEYLSEFSK